MQPKHKHEKTESNVQCAYFGLGRMNINQRIKSVFWRIYDDGSELVHLKEVKPFEKESVEFADNRVNAAVKYHNEKWFHTELVAKAEHAIVESQYAYAVHGLRTIIGSSIRTRGHLPSPIPVIKAALGRKRKLKKAILFDGSMGINYFHFISDVLHKIYLLEEFTSIDCPILVGQAVWSKPFFQYFIRETELSRYDWQQINEPVQADELWIARPLPYERNYWLRTKELFIQEDQVVDAANAIFINRTGTRHITNLEAIEPILRKYRVVIVDPGSMNISKQAALFNSASHIIGIHGAGMTNIVFCNHEKTKVLELCSNNRIGTQYYWLCTALGVNWDMILGGIADTDQSFELDPLAFEKRLVEFLAN